MKLKFIIGKDNTQKIKLLDDSTGSLAASNLNALTRVTLRLGDILIDSNHNSSYFDWSGNDGTILINIGQSPDLVSGVFRSVLTVYDGSQPNGIRWEPEFRVEIKE